MSYLHSLDILHGDLSGGNILLASSDMDARNFTAKVHRSLTQISSHLKITGPLSGGGHRGGFLQSSRACLMWPTYVTHFMEACQQVQPDLLCTGSRHLTLWMSQQSSGFLASEEGLLIATG